MIETSPPPGRAGQRSGELLEEATRLSGEKTYSAAVMRALEDFISADAVLEFEDVVTCLPVPPAVTLPVLVERFSLG